MIYPVRTERTNELKLEGRGNLYWVPEQEDITGSLLLKAAASYEFIKGHSADIQVSGGGAVSALPYLDKFDLYNTEDLSIRSDQNLRDLLVEEFLLINFEYRFSLLKFFIPPIFNIGIKGFLFTDLGWAAEYNRILFEEPLRDAYGAGLRIVLDNPVFASFSFSYGINRYGKGRFVFAVTSGF